MLAAFYLLGFGVLAVAVPRQASVYLDGFASSVRVHVLELVARLGPDATEPNSLIYLAYLGALLLVGGVFTLAVGILRSSRR
jgi:hypothetical protein